MVDFRKPLVEGLAIGHISWIFKFHTFARTLSKDGGLTIEKQMRKTSV